MILSSTAQLNKNLIIKKKKNHWYFQKKAIIIVKNPQLKKNLKNQISMNVKKVQSKNSIKNI